MDEPLLLIEPGRSIVGDAGLTLVRVGYTKKVAMHHHLVVVEMGAVNHAGSLLHKLVHRWEILTRPGERDEGPFEAFVAGNLCYNGDMIARYRLSEKDFGKAAGSEARRRTPVRRTRPSD